MVLAVSFARIHWQNLISFGILPLRFADPADVDKIEVGHPLCVLGARAALTRGPELWLDNPTHGSQIRAEHDLNPRQVEAILAGSVIGLGEQPR